MMTGQNMIMFSTLIIQICVLIATENASAGNIVLVLLFSQMLQVPLMMLGGMLGNFAQSYTDAIRLKDIVDLAFFDDSQTISLCNTTPIRSLEFRNVSFSYPKSNRVVLNAVSFKLLSAVNACFVGDTGSGKSTIIKLIKKYYHFFGGTILLNDTDILNLSIASVRSRIGVISQDCNLFDNTIRYNITYGAQNMVSVVDKELLQICERASLTSFLERLEHGLDTEIGESGIKLSGGEKQRISIARAIIKDADILICDEATSALDNITEADVQNALMVCGNNRLSITIAHRLTTIRKCDVIFVLSNGSIVERGNHTQLLQFNGEYERLWSCTANETQKETTSDNIVCSSQNKTTETIYKVAQKRRQSNVAKFIRRFSILSETL